MGKYLDQEAKTLTQHFTIVGSFKHTVNAVISQSAKSKQHRTALTIANICKKHGVSAAPEELRYGGGFGLGVNIEVEPKMLELPDPKRFPAHKNAREAMQICLLMLLLDCRSILQSYISTVKRSNSQTHCMQNLSLSAAWQTAAFRAQT